MLVNKRKNQSRVNQIILAMKKARISKGITRYKLAQDTGLSDSSISNIEQLKQNPTLSTLIEMSISLDFDLPKAIKENYPDSDGPKDDQEQMLGFSPTFDLIIDCLKKMDEDKLQVIYNVAKALNTK